MAINVWEKRRKQIQVMQKSSKPYQEDNDLIGILSGRGDNFS